MPLFEYQCGDCGKVSEILIRNAQQVPECLCGSQNMQKQFSSFAVSDAGSSGGLSGCSDGRCGLPSSPCASGMCGL